MGGVEGRDEPALRGCRQQRLQAVLAHLFTAHLPAFRGADPGRGRAHHEAIQALAGVHAEPLPHRSEEHTSELQSLMRISYAVFCLTKKHYYSVTPSLRN